MADNADSKAVVYLFAAAQFVFTFVFPSPLSFLLLAFLVFKAHGFIDVYRFVARNWLDFSGFAEKADTWRRHIEAASAAPRERSARGDGLVSYDTIQDNYESLADLNAALAQSGVEGVNMIVGIDFTASNSYKGAETNGGRSLHDTSAGGLNQYQQVIKTLCDSIAYLDEDNDIPIYGFGDLQTKQRSVFDMTNGRSGAARRSNKGGRLMTKEEIVNNMLRAYADTAASVVMSGPTSFAPIIRKAVEIVEKTRSYHILVIVTDGISTDFDRDARAVINASNYPLSIICVGVGDGPFDQMEAFDDDLAGRRFDNFQFVDFNKIMRMSDPVKRSEVFAITALQEIPAQYATICKMGLLK